MAALSSRSTVNVVSRVKKKEEEEKKMLLTETKRSEEVEELSTGSVIITVVSYTLQNFSRVFARTWARVRAHTYTLTISRADNVTGAVHLHTE